MAAARATARGVQGEAQSFPATRPGATRPCDATGRKLRAGVFFDGTDNNKARDEPRQGHTNVVRLYNVYKDTATPQEKWVKQYIVGLGSMDTDARQRQAERERAEVKDKWFGARWGREVTSRGRHLADTGANVAGLAGGLGGQERLNRAYFWLRDRCGEMPLQACKTVDVFGFSRGAALARTFINLVNMALRRSQPHVTVRFVGIYDSVGSFGKAGDDSNPGQNMYVDATDMMDLRHFVARHEYRENFPLSYITGVDREYPGAHSDVGGSYPPLENGKVNHLAFIPFRDMYQAGIRWTLWKLAWTTQLHGLAVNAVQPLKVRSDQLAGPATKPMTSHQRLTEAQREFFNRYIHESGVRPRGLVAGVWNDGVAGHVTNVGNQIDPAGRRRRIPHRRLRLTAMPPSFKWK